MTVRPIVFRRRVELITANGSANRVFKTKSATSQSVFLSSYTPRRAVHLGALEIYFTRVLTLIKKWCLVTRYVVLKLKY